MNMKRYMLEALACLRNQKLDEDELKNDGKLKKLTAGVSISVHAHVQEGVGAQVSGGSAGLAGALAIQRWLDDRHEGFNFPEALFTGIVTLDGRVSRFAVLPHY